MKNLKWNTLDELMEQIEMNEIQNKPSYRLWRFWLKLKQLPSNIFYWLRCNHFFGWNKYHLLDLRTKFYRWGWRDQDFRILAANFKCLQNFIEEEKGLEVLSWEDNVMIKHEIEHLYDWWKIYSSTDGKDDEDKEDEMLIRLIKVRRYLWT